MLCYRMRKCIDTYLCYA